MTEKLKQTIKEEVAKLTKENQSVINSFGWEKIAEEIGKKYLLLDDEINDLQVETLLVLVGLQDPDFYTQNIENEVGTSKNEAEKIASEIIQKIFSPISEKILENIKKSDKIKNATPEQNLNFILSGGDYSAFLDNPLLEPPYSPLSGGNNLPPLTRGGQEGLKGAGGGDSKENHLAFGTPPSKGGEDETILPVFSIKK